jgi:multicomponent Na+:H+ antiporter subunit C
MTEFLGVYHYWVFAALFATGLYGIIAKRNLIKKLIALAVFQSAVFLLYIAMNKVDGGTAPIIQSGELDVVYSNPVPQVLILTAIVVGIATLALGLAIVVRIRESYGTVEEDELLEMERE